MRVAVVGSALIFVLTGCGGGARRQVQGSSASATSTTPRIVQPGVVSGSLAVVRDRLVAAGFPVGDPRSNTGGGSWVQMLEYRGVAISSYRTSAAASAEYQAVLGTYAGKPDQGIARLAENRVYFFVAGRPLTTAQRARFAKVFSVAEPGQ
jgi:hypothetical protein